METNSNQASASAVPNQRYNFKIIFSILVLLAVVGGGSYYLGTQSNNTLINTAPTAVPTIRQLPTPTPTDALNLQTGNIPSDWTWKPGTYCTVKFPLPPDKEPYIEYTDQDTSDPKNKRFWQLRESNQSEDGNTVFTNTSRLSYSANNLGNGFIAGQVNVQCAPKGAYSLDTIAENYAAGFAGAGITVKSKRMAKAWGKDVLIAQFEGGMFGSSEIYFVIGNDQIYKIDKRSDSDRELVKSTTERIFNYLQFPD